MSESSLRPPFRAEHIGSLLRPKDLTGHGAKGLLYLTGREQGRQSSGQHQ